MSKTTKQMRATAYHESGHVVGLIYCGLTFDYVTIRASYGIVGHVELSEELKLLRGKILDEHESEPFKPTSEEKELIEKMMVTALSAFHSEYKFTGRRNNIKAKGDLLEVHTWANIDRSEKAANKYIDYLQVVASEIFEMPFYWKLTELIAEELLEKDTLSQSDVFNLKEKILESDPSLSFLV